MGRRVLRALASRFKPCSTYIEEGDTLDSFLRDFSTVTREEAIQFLELAKAQLVECVNPRR
jgi:hypothetical protein